METAAHSRPAVGQFQLAAAGSYPKLAAAHSPQRYHYDCTSGSADRPLGSPPLLAGIRSVAVADKRPMSCNAATGAAWNRSAAGPLRQ